MMQAAADFDSESSLSITEQGVNTFFSLIYDKNREREPREKPAQAGANPKLIAPSP
jgi:hypothetical protein